MSGKKARTTEPQADRRYRVGGRVWFTFGLSRVTGVIVEDRGIIGPGGRRLYRIEAPFGGENLVAELPAEKLQPA